MKHVVMIFGGHHIDHLNVVSVLTVDDEITAHKVCEILSNAIPKRMKNEIDNGLTTYHQRVRYMCVDNMLDGLSQHIPAEDLKYIKENINDKILL